MIIDQGDPALIRARIVAALQQCQGCRLEPAQVEAVVAAQWQRFDNARVRTFIEIVVTRASACVLAGEVA